MKLHPKFSTKWQLAALPDESTSGTEFPRSKCARNAPSPVHLYKGRVSMVPAPALDLQQCVHPPEKKILTRGIKGNWRDKKRCGDLPQVSNILLPAKNSAMPKVRKSPIRNVVHHAKSFLLSQNNLPTPYTIPVGLVWVYGRGRKIREEWKIRLVK